MKIKIKVSIVASVLMLFFVGMATILFVSYQEIGVLYTKGHVSISGSRITSDLLTLTYKYGATSEENVKRQWFIRNKDLDGLLLQALEMNADSDEKTLLREMKRLSTAAGIKFAQLTASDDNVLRLGMAATRQNRDTMVNTIVKDLSSIVPLTDRLHDTVKADIRRYTNYEIAAALLLVLTVILVVPPGLYTMIYSITSRLDQLQKGMSAVSSGILNYRITVGTLDEIGSVAQGFNAMTEKLEKITVNRDELAIEVLERVRVQEQLHLQTVELEDEVAERQMAQECLQEKALLLEEEIEKRQEAQNELEKLNEQLEQRVKERTVELEEKNAELYKMNRLFVGRELKMVELKERIRELEKKEELT